MLETGQKLKLLKIQKKLLHLLTLANIGHSSKLSFRELLANVGEKIKDTRKSNGSNEQFEGNVDKHSRILNNLKFSMKLLAFSCLMWLYSKPGNICSKVTQKGKTCSRLLETLKVALNPRFDPFDSKVEL